MHFMPLEQIGCKRKLRQQVRGVASRILRHNEVRAVLGKAFADIGYTMDSIMGADSRTTGNQVK